MNNFEVGNGFGEGFGGFTQEITINRATGEVTVNEIPVEAPATVAELQEEKEIKPAPVVEAPVYKKEDWEINMPTDNETMMLKKKYFSYEVYSAVVLQSKWNQQLKENHRYIYKNNFSKKECWETLKDKCMTYKTFLNLFDELIERGFIIEDTYNGEEVYKIPTKFDAGYLLFDNRFLSKANRLFNRNIIKVYIQYYKYCYKNSNTGAYKMPQSKTLEAIGMCGNEKNKEFLRDVNKLLVELGLITITEVKHHSGTPLEIRCPHYKESNFFKNVVASNGKK